MAPQFRNWQQPGFPPPPPEKIKLRCLYIYVERAAEQGEGSLKPRVIFRSSRLHLPTLLQHFLGEDRRRIRERGQTEIVEEIEVREGGPRVIFVSSMFVWNKSKNRPRPLSSAGLKMFELDADIT